MSGPVRVLFLCAGNSARSQMAEALVRRRASGRFAVASAGVTARGVNPLAVQALGEVGVDWTAARSTALGEVLGRTFDVVVTLCDEAREACPAFPGAGRQLHWAFDDPAAAPGTDEERLAAFRRVRDEIDARVVDAVRSGELEAAGDDA